MVFISYNSSDPFNGVMDYVANINGDPMTYITYESTKNTQDLNQLFYYQSGYSWMANFSKSTTSYFGVFFKKNVFVITSYAAHSSLNAKDSPLHPINWTVTGSLDGEKWLTIDEHVNDQTLNANATIAHFRTLEIPVRHIRFNYIGIFCLRHLDFYGILSSAQYYIPQSACFKCISFNYLYLYVFVLA